MPNFLNPLLLVFYMLSGTSKTPLFNPFGAVEVFKIIGYVILEKVLASIK